MKKFLSSLFIIIMITAFSCKPKTSEKISTDLVNNPVSATDHKNGGFGKFQFEEDFFNFGNVTRGEKVTHEFKFKNIGKADLVITEATGSCGCTVPEFPKGAIPPGKEDVIKVTFNSEGKQGIQNKTISIVANTQPNTTVIKIICNVIVPE
ncbi:MAG: DUF1573 domain-containing protein [Bacteroidales bacterium]|nr:DUF1573 domain-containing protein [Bacteroidales bacterium]